LIVDDEFASARMLQRNLEENGAYEARVERWPEDAVATAHGFNPDLILLDLLMPRMPGGNVAAAFEADPLLKNVPIVFLTAGVGRSRVEEHEGIICNHPCVAKPASVEEIVQCIEANLRM
jgi:CheY-like chemotaxis protein